MKIPDENGPEEANKPDPLIRELNGHVTRSPWLKFRPAIVCWVLLLACNGILGLSVYISNNSSPAMELIFLVPVVIIIFFYTWKDRRNVAPLFSRSGFTRKSWGWPLAALVAIWAFMFLYMECVTFIGFEELSSFDDYIEYGWPIWSAFIMVSFIPAVLEEIAFRGFIMSRLESVMKPADSLILQATMFSTLHLLPMIFLSHFVIGFILGVVRVKTRSLYPSILVHMLWNAYVLLTDLP